MGLLVITGLYLIAETNIYGILIFVFTLIIGIVYNAKLLTAITSKDGVYIFETYSIISQKEKFKIPEAELVAIQYNNHSIFNSYNLVLIHKGKYGNVKKQLSLNAPPWSELTGEIIKIQKSLTQNSMA